MIVGNCNSTNGEDEENRDEGEEFVHDCLGIFDCLFVFYFE